MTKNDFWEVGQEVENNYVPVGDFEYRPQPVYSTVAAVASDILDT